MNAWSLVLVVAFVFGGQSGGDSPSKEEVQRRVQEDSQRVERINELAGNIRSEQDARAVVELVTQTFDKEIPAGWPITQLKERIARAEFRSATDSSELISDERLAEVWNEYMKSIGAAAEAQTNAAEIHNLRDAQYTTAQFMWGRHFNQTIWTAPNIAALDSDGKVASGSRALEAIRTLYAMHMSYMNLLGARERVAKGIVASEEAKKRAERESLGQVKVESRLVAGVAAVENPVRTAEYQFLREHGWAEMSLVVMRVVDRLFPE